MSLRFSNEGPEFPGDLIDSLLNGEVVFLCGSGISSPPLPGFKELVECIVDGVKRAAHAWNLLATMAGRQLRAVSRNIAGRGRGPGAGGGGKRGRARPVRIQEARGDEN